MTTPSLAPTDAPPPASPSPGVHARAISLADRVARGFPPLACVRGFRYFARKRVTLSNVSDAGLDADVRGKRTLHVRLRAEGGQLGAACTCSPKVLGAARCRHVWATLLEVDRQVLLASLRTSCRTLALVALDVATKKPKAPAAARTRARPPREGRREDCSPERMKALVRAALALAAGAVVVAALERLTRSGRGKADFVRALVARMRPAPVGDGTVALRVRRRLARTALEPAAIRVRIEHGCVDLRGRVGTRERARIVRAVARVRGVDSVIDLMTETPRATPR